MKKILSIALMALMVLPVFAGKTPKNWNFENNEEGECIVDRSFETSKADGAASIKAVRTAMNKQSLDAITVLSEEEGVNIVYQIRKNTKSRYNPFAGMFQEFMEFKMTATYAEGKINLHIAEMTLQNLYAGFGAKVETEGFSGKIDAYKQAEETVATSKGKAKKEAQEKIEEINDSFNACQEELDKILDVIQSTVK